MRFFDLTHVLAANYGRNDAALARPGAPDLGVFLPKHVPASGRLTLSYQAFTRSGKRRGECISGCAARNHKPFVTAQGSNAPGGIALDSPAFDQIYSVLCETCNSASWAKAEIGTSGSHVPIAQSQNTALSVPISLATHILPSRVPSLSDVSAGLCSPLTPHVQTVAAAAVNVAFDIAFDYHQKRPKRGRLTAIRHPAICERKHPSVGQTNSRIWRVGAKHNVKGITTVS